MNLIIQDALVTVVASGAFLMLVNRVTRVIRPARGAAGCAACPTCPSLARRLTDQRRHPASIRLDCEADIAIRSPAG